MSINFAAVSGNVTRDAELRFTASETPVVRFGIAFNERKKNAQTGVWEDRTNFVDCAMFGSRAEKLQPYISKGAKVAIQGRLHWSQWETEGQKRSKIEIVVDDVDLMSRGASRDNESNSDERSYGREQNGASDRLSVAQEAARQAIFGNSEKQQLAYDDIPF